MTSAFLHSAGTLSANMHSVVKASNGILNQYLLPPVKFKLRLLCLHCLAKKFMNSLIDCRLS